MPVRATVNGVDFTGNPCRVVAGQFNGRPLTAGERVWAALLAFQAWLDKRHPGLYVYVIQSAYRSGYAPSAGTHDLDRVLDTAIVSNFTGRRVWLRGRRWWRRFGWACWWRHVGAWWKPSSWHFHQVLLGGDCPVGYLVPGQISDYYNHRTGLVGHLLEPGWYPKDIDATVFDFEAWLSKQEDEMKPEDFDKIREIIREEIDGRTDEIAAAAAKAVMASPVIKSLDVSVREALRKGLKRADG